MDKKYNFKSEVEENIGVSWAINCVAQTLGEHVIFQTSHGYQIDEKAKELAYKFLDLREQIKSEIRLANAPKGKSVAEKKDNVIESAKLDFQDE